ncbi:MAG: hypothetical protein QOE90_3363 [Thermoplasmata archaeon]|jgi:hypothetical protein|nr:hypothetical protein [Thermoplasmata archaeon]
MNVRVIGIAALLLTVLLSPLASADPSYRISAGTDTLNTTSADIGVSADGSTEAAVVFVGCGGGDTVVSRLDDVVGVPGVEGVPSVGQTRLSMTHLCMFTNGIPGHGTVYLSLQSERIPADGELFGAGAPSGGEMEVTFESGDSGTFTSTLVVNYDLRDGQDGPIFTSSSTGPITATAAPWEREAGGDPVRAFCHTSDPKLAAMWLAEHHCVIAGGSTAGDFVPGKGPNADEPHSASRLILPAHGPNLAGGLCDVATNPNYVPQQAVHVFAHGATSARNRGLIVTSFDTSGCLAGDGDRETAYGGAEFPEYPQGTACDSPTGHHNGGPGATVTVQSNTLALPVVYVAGTDGQQPGVDVVTSPCTGNHVISDSYDVDPFDCGQGAIGVYLVATATSATLEPNVNPHTGSTTDPDPWAALYGAIPTGSARGDPNGGECQGVDGSAWAALDFGPVDMGGGVLQSTPISGTITAP